MTAIIEARLSDIDVSETIRYMGVDKTYAFSSSGLSENIHETISEIISASRPKLVYRIAQISELEALGLSFEGKDIPKLLEGCESAVVFAATLGSGVDGFILRQQSVSMTHALIADAAASAAIENVCDNFEEDLRQQFKDIDMGLTSRFSPGYGDEPLETQKAFISFLKADKWIGLTLTDSMMMMPVKSVTAVIGIFEGIASETLSEGNIERCKTDCNVCSMKKTCVFRKESSK